MPAKSSDIEWKLFMDLISVVFGHFWTFLDRNKILNFSGKNAETYISEIKTQAGH